MNISSINSFKVMPRFGNTVSQLSEQEMTDEEFKRISEMPDAEFKKLPKAKKAAWAAREAKENSYDGSNDIR